MEPTGRLVTSTRHDANAINRLVGDVLAGAGVTDDISGTWIDPRCATLWARSSVDRPEAGHGRELPGVVAR